MKAWIMAAAAGLLTVTGNIRADLTIVSKVEALGENLETKAEYKGSRMRVDAAPNTSLIMNLKTGDMIQLAQAQKTYLEVAGEVTQQAIDTMKKTPGAAKPQPTPTGKKDTISGYEAEEYACTVAGTRLSLWLTKALPDYDKVLKEMEAAFSQGPLSSMMQDYGLDLASLPGFPIRTVNEAQPGQATTTTVVSVSLAPIPDADFEVPAGYKKVSVPTLTPPAGVAASPTPGQ